MILPPVAKDVNLLSKCPKSFSSFSLSLGISDEMCFLVMVLVQAMSRYQFIKVIKVIYNRLNCHVSFVVVYLDIAFHTYFDKLVPGNIKNINETVDTCTSLHIMPPVAM